jgi:hypothetical protein
MQAPIGYETPQTKRRGLDLKKTTNALLANLIHAIDGGFIRKIIERLLGLKLTLCSSVHDCVGLASMEVSPMLCAINESMRTNPFKEIKSPLSAERASLAGQTSLYTGASFDERLQVSIALDQGTDAVYFGLGYFDDTVEVVEGGKKRKGFSPFIVL